ncbi:hypothetical protein ILUMI_04893, partial [Ignelater luminosus]
PPAPAGPWEGILDATKDHPVCPQRNIYTRSEIIEGDENCLYLNVYTPQLSTKETTLHPVMIFFHGGGWLCGGGNSLWYGPDILLDKDVVLVIPNFRLGPLGFLSTGDEIVPGNNGLKDQNLAMKWVKKNIAKFGGDPNRITLFGESAGGVSAHLHMLSPLSKGLFHGAISQSGTAHTNWSLAPNGEGAKHSKQLAESLHCPTECSQRMVECLREVDAYEIIAKDKIFMKWDSDPMIPFKPVIEPNVEGAFLTEHPTDIIKSGKASDVPWITGLNTEDGVLRAAAIYGNPHLVEDLDKDFNRVVSISLFYNETATNTDFIGKQIRKFYFGDKKIDNSTRFNVVDMYTDGWFLAGADESVRLHLKYSKSPVFYYLFGHHGVASFSQVFGDPSQRYGVCHADELQYLFPVGDALFPDKTPDEFDKRIADILTTLWVNFAKVKNPTPDDELDCIIHAKWEPVQTEDLEYFYIGGGVHAAKGLLLERAKFWRNLPLNSQREDFKDEL